MDLGVHILPGTYLGISTNGAYFIYSEVRV